jgi:DNA-binding CsgD family transcriptional regulator
MIPSVEPHEVPRDSGPEYNLQAVVWDAVSSDPSVGVLIADEKGRAVFCNDQAAEVYRGPGAKGPECLGLGWAARLPSDAVQQRIKILESVKALGKPMAIRAMFGGIQTLVVVHPIPPHADGPMRFLMMLRPVPGDGSADEVTAGLPLIKTNAIDLGPLNVLSPRELEVLALVGQNLSSKAIAEILHRSEKTIENHRYSISKKLDGAGATKLAALARRAGLTMEDASRKRFPMPPKPPSE